VTWLSPPGRWAGRGRSRMPPSFSPPCSGARPAGAPGLALHRRWYDQLLASQPPLCKFQDEILFFLGQPPHYFCHFLGRPVAAGQRRQQPGSPEDIFGWFSECAGDAKAKVKTRVRLTTQDHRNGGGP